jgi:Holliday junction resolvase RusA-like endonuclease
MNEVNVFLTGQPVGKGRPRFTRSGHVYTPDKTKRYEMRLAGEASNVMMVRQLDPITVPCKVLIRAQFQIPKSWTKAKKLQAERREIFPGKPDIDNVAKIVLDAFNGVVFEDDKQVHALRVLKAFGDPCLSVSVSW